MMKKNLIAALALSLSLLAVGASAESVEPVATGAPAQTGVAQDAAEPQAPALKLTTEYRWFTNSYRYTRSRKVTYYDNVYAYNHGEYYLTPFASDVPAEYIVEDENGSYAVAPIVLDITDAMRERLYGGDLGETAMFYGQYCERIRDKAGRLGFSGIHEGVDFVYKPGAQLYAILGGVVTRAGDSNGTVAVYNEEYDCTVLYLHCRKISVRRGDVLEAGAKIAVEGNKKSGSDYTHVELRLGRHTSSSPYRDIKLTSDCPYAIMQAALGVTDSGRQPATEAAMLRAQQMREEAEAAARAAAEAEAAAKAAEEAQKNEEPDVELLDELPGTQAGYGFGEAAPEATVTPVPQTPAAVEATLPPSNP